MFKHKFKTILLGLLVTLAAKESNAQKKHGFLNRSFARPKTSSWAVDKVKFTPINIGFQPAYGTTSDMQDGLSRYTIVNDTEGMLSLRRHNSKFTILGGVNAGFAMTMYQNAKEINGIEYNNNELDLFVGLVTGVEMIIGDGSIGLRARGGYAYTYVDKDPVDSAIKSNHHKNGGYVKFVLTGDIPVNEHLNVHMEFGGATSTISKRFGPTGSIGFSVNVFDQFQGRRK